MNLSLDSKSKLIILPTKPYFMTPRTFSPAIHACLALLMVFTMLACNNKQPLDTTIVAGHLPDLASAEIKTNIGDQEFIVSTDAEGKFQLELDISWHQYLWFNGINRNLFLVSGDSMFISDEVSASHPFVFTGGESGLINTWYTLKDAKLSTLLDTVNVKNYYSQDALSYKKLNTWIISEFHNLLDQFCQENPGIGDSFIALEKANISHYWYYELNVYHFENNAYTGNKPELPDHFYDYLETIRLNDTMLFEYEGYRYFLYSWLDLQVHLQDKGLTGVSKTHQIFDIAEEAFSAPAILADVIWENLRLQNNRMQVDEELIARASAMGVAEGKLEDAREYMERLQPLSAGNPAPAFEIRDVNGKIARLNDFSGKYLLIDVWSHTCGPCVREIPRLEDIKHEMEGRNIEVITVCLSYEEPWKNKMKELGLPDEGQYRLDKGWESPFNNNYLRGAGVPTYIIIDPEGKFVDARAPFPSQGMRELLEALSI